MLANATILRIDPSIAPTSSGALQWATGQDLTACRLRCAYKPGVEDKAVGSVAGSLQRIASASVELKPAALLAAMTRVGQAALLPVTPEMRVLVKGDDGTQQLYRVTKTEASGRGAVASLKWTLVVDA